jgi:hypothetical protein
MNRLRRLAVALYIVMFFAALFFLGMVYGVIAVRSDLPPGAWLGRAVIAMEAWHEYLFQFHAGNRGLKQRQLVILGRWQRERTKEKGVLRHSPDRTYPGYTLFTSAHEQGARLIDMDGHVVHEWKKTFDEVWPDGRHLAPTPLVDPDFIMWRHAHVYPNGDILAVFEGIGVTPWGFGLAKLDMNSNVIWTCEERVHHELDVAPDGTIAALSHQLRDRPIEDLSYLRTPLVEDFVIILTPDGRVVSKWSLYEGLADSPWRPYLELVPEKDDQDYLHANTVKFVPVEFAAANPPVSAGDLMITLREPNLVLIIRPSTGKVVWARSMPCRAPHHATPLPNGNMMIFDNQGRRERGGISRVVEFCPRSGAAVWSFHGNKQEYFFSLVRCSQQVLPNNNVLITESDAGRLLEVTRNGDIVWEWRTPHRGETLGLPEAVPIICTGVRYTPEQLPFLEKQK